MNLRTQDSSCIPQGLHNEAGCIIETPRDTTICFLTSGIDDLVLHNILMSKNAAHKALGPLVVTYINVASMVASNIKA